MATLEHLAAHSYAHVHAQTAGTLKSYQLLLEKAILLTRQAREDEDLVARDHAQDILAQLQHALNTRMSAAQYLYEMLGILWDALEWNEKPYYKRVEDLLRQYNELIKAVQKM